MTVLELVVLVVLVVVEMVQLLHKILHQEELILGVDLELAVLTAEEHLQVDQV